MDEEVKILGAIERKKDPRDLLLGAAAAPAAIPPTFLPDNSWLQRNFQGKTPFCGMHAGTHFQAILDHYQTPEAVQRYSPRYGAIKLKSPSSPVYDGFPIEAGTSMTAIFKWLQKVGADDYEPLENDVTLPLATYCEASAVTPQMDADALNHTIENYAFDALTFQALQQAIYQYKAVILLIKCDDGFWGTATPTFTTRKYTHFVVADGYDNNNLRLIDSADPDNAFAVKMMNQQYVGFIVESGTAIDKAQAQAIQSAIVTDASAVVNDVAQDTQMPIPQKESIVEEVKEFVEEIL